MVIFLLIGIVMSFYSCQGSDKRTLEGELLAALEDSALVAEDFNRMLVKVPEDALFSEFESWRTLIVDEEKQAWRRVAAGQIFFGKFAAFPLQLDEFQTTFIESLGVENEAWVDMSVAQVLPIERKPDRKILMANLPIPTDAGFVAIYLSVHVESGLAEEFALSPPFSYKQP